MAGRDTKPDVLPPQNSPIEPPIPPPQFRFEVNSVYFRHRETKDGRILQCALLTRITFELANKKLDKAVIPLKISVAPQCILANHSDPSLEIIGHFPEDDEVVPMDKLDVWKRTMMERPVKSLGLGINVGEINQEPIRQNVRPLTFRYTAPTLTCSACHGKCEALKWELRGNNAVERFPTVDILLLINIRRTADHPGWPLYISVSPDLHITTFGLKRKLLAYFKPSHPPRTGWMYTIGGDHNPDKAKSILEGLEQARAASSRVEAH